MRSGRASMKRVAMRRHVDDAVVGGHEQARATRHPIVECRDLGVELFEVAEPSIGLPPVRVGRLIELGHVEVDHRRLGLRHHSERLGEPVGDGGARAVLRAAQHGVREARVGIAWGADRERRAGRARAPARRASAPAASDSGRMPSSHPFSWFTRRSPSASSTR